MEFSGEKLFEKKFFPDLLRKSELTPFSKTFKRKRMTQFVQI